MSFLFSVETQNSSVESKIVVALERLSVAFRVLLWEESKRNSLSPIQIQILIFLLYHSKEKSKVSYLASEFNLSKATISESIGSLLRKGLITRKANPDDTRSYNLQLTAPGMRLAIESADFAAAMVNPLALLATDQKETMLLALLHIIRELNRSGIIAIQRMCFTCAYYSVTNGSNYCRLLQSGLANSELRVDCGEYISASEVAKPMN